MSKKHDAYIEQIKKDALAMAIQLLQVGESSLSPECKQAMDRWRYVAKLNATHRDRDAPRRAPLPHHRTYGSVSGGSAGQSRHK